MIVVIASGRQDDQATKTDYAIKINSQAAARRHSVCQIQVTVRDQLHRRLRKIGYIDPIPPRNQKISCEQPLIKATRSLQQIGI